MTPRQREKAREVLPPRRASLLHKIGRKFSSSGSQSSHIVAAEPSRADSDAAEPDPAAQAELEDATPTPTAERPDPLAHERLRAMETIQAVLTPSQEAMQREEMFGDPRVRLPTQEDELEP